VQSGPLSPQITLKARLKEYHNSSFYNPGPGACKSISNVDNVPKFLAENGKYFLSTIKNISSPALKSSNASYKKIENLPGPGAYEFKENFNPRGTYFDSKFRNSSTHSFARLQKDRPLSKGLPNVGPGTYNQQTEFGRRTRA
jgi:hypothetical protein